MSVAPPGSPKWKYDQKRHQELRNKFPHIGLAEIPDYIFEAIDQKERDDNEIITYGEFGQFSAPKSRGMKYQDTPPDMPGADQTARDQCDINFIMRRFEKTGQLADLIAQGMANLQGRNFGDFTDMPTFQEALDIVNHAQDQFSKLDAPVRNRFNNNPALFLDFMNDPKNAEEWYKMGLAVKKPEPPKETTLADVVQTLKETRQTKNTKPKGKESDEE